MRSSDRWARHTPRSSPGPQMRRFLLRILLRLNLRKPLSLLPAQMPPTQRRQGSYLVKMPRSREVGLKNPPGSAQKRGSQRRRHHLLRQRLPQLLPCTRRGGDTARVVTGGESKQRHPASARRTRERVVTGRVEVSVRKEPQKGPEQISLF